MYLNWGVDYKSSGEQNLFLRAAAITSILALMVLTPRPWGYVAVLALAYFYRKRAMWRGTAPMWTIYAILIYAIAFAIDFIAVGPPAVVPPWWEAVILAPLAEEYVFRVLPFSALPSPLSWVFAVVIFGVLHKDNPLLASLYGVALSLMYKGGGYPASVALHAFNNCIWWLMAAGGF
ncbi:CPBP family intramembrane metalloprotease [Pyrobaculum aerophilum]|nr:CPBP family intramembrane metalloprotease [Pyrobaculum aerophilum]RFA98192.1 CPBP family intramembrane metalloprotease [Pyrobaculum aerophilum]